MKELFVSLFPPDVPAVVKWRLSIFAAVALMAAHVAWACGWLENLGIGSGFAYSEDVEKVQEDVSSIKLALIEQRLFDVRLRQCSASSQEAKRFYLQQLQELMSEYQRLTEREHKPPSCEELQ